MSNIRVDLQIKKCLPIIQIFVQMIEELIIVYDRGLVFEMGFLYIKKIKLKNKRTK